VYRVSSSSLDNVIYRDGIKCKKDQDNQNIINHERKKIPTFIPGHLFKKNWLVTFVSFYMELQHE
jgi:hypothetical protein